jgi:hypothetical protein
VLPSYLTLVQSLGSFLANPDSYTHESYPMNTKPEFDTSSIRSIRSAAITEYTPVSATVSRIIATFVGRMPAQDALDRITAVLGGRARPIQSSFRWLEENRSAIGFVTVAKSVKEFNSTVEAKMQKVTANLFMDQKDESLWKLEQGAGGKYLTRQGTDNLAELLEASRISPRGGTPRMSSILSASVRTKQFAAFVPEDGQMVDYGFCVEVGNGAYKVQSYTTGQTAVVSSDAVVGVYSVDLPAHVTAGIGAAPAPKGIKASADTDAQIEYWKKAYSYAPAYVDMLVKQVEQMAAL